MCRLSIQYVCFYPQGASCLHRKHRLETPRREITKKKRKKKGRTWHQSTELRLIMSEKTKERGLVRRSNHRGDEKTKKELEGTREVRRQRDVMGSGGEKKRLQHGGRQRDRGRTITLMRRKSWLRQASRDRRPRRTQSSISPSYERNTVRRWMEGGRESGGGQDRGWGGQRVKYNKCDRD